MKRKALLALLMTISLTAGAAGPQSALELYQQALVQEQAVGNLPDAIDLYRKAANGAAGNDRGLAARALIRAAASYEKLGQPAASELYAEVMRTYPEQREQVAYAQSRIAALKRPSPRSAQTNSVRAGRTDVSSVFDPIFEMYCATCHNQNRKSAGLALDTLNTANVSENTAVWERILRRLRARRDPPYSVRRPDEGTYQAAVSALELALDQAYPANASLNTDRVSDAEFAARIAKFIWNGTPDAILMDVVQRGRLREPAVLEQQVRRMLRDAKANSLVTEFFERWILSDAFDKVQNPSLPPSERLTDFDETLRQAIKTETRLFLESQIHEDHNALDLWTANYTYVNDRLARHYGIPGISGSGFQRVTLPDGTRAGILGQASFLTVSSMSNRTSPVQRGKMMLAIFLGIMPPDPPPNVPPLKTDNPRAMRLRMEEHESNPACANCHLTFEPLGLALENFNAIGQWRSTDGGSVIDTSGTFVDGTRFNGPAELRAALVKYREAYYSNVAQTLLGYALGRKARTWRVYDYEMPSVRAIVREAGTNDDRWSSIVVGIVRSTPFQMKTIVP
jgi:tetratricopeptide (TPR) repeat protein